MARSSYGAPGVYVEEVPSARQPIAGVGTNTVGFIGIVPDRIYCPVVNPKYDPVKAAKDAAKAAVEAAAKPDEATRLALANKEKALNDADLVEANKIGAKTTELAAANDALAKLPKEADAAARKPLADKVTEAQQALETAKTAKARIDTRASASAAASAAPAPTLQADDSVDAAYQNTVPSSDLQQPSDTRPYYFVPFDIKADAFDTKLCTNFTEYVDRFGDFSGFGDRGPLNLGHHLLTHAVSGFFRNGGTRCFVSRIESAVGLAKALERFESIDEVAILAAPGLPKSKAAWEELQDYCESTAHQNVFAILDSPADVEDASKAIDIQKLTYDDVSKSLLPRTSNHAAFYFPHIEVSDPAKRLQDEDPARGVDSKYRGLTYVAPSGHMAGVYARIDEERGVHKAPANAVVRGALEVKYYVSKPKQDLLNPQGVNCIRIMNGTVVVWGARTIGGDRNGEWKYINVRRFAGFLEESIDEGTQWVVFEPNDPSLWSKIRLNVTAFLTNVWRNGALFGLTPDEAFYVKCDAELNPPEVRDLGQVITEIGVAIVRPAEFVIFRISQSTGAQKG